MGDFRTLVLGHRGAPVRVPENTLASFAAACAAGADGVELDVQRAADGLPVVIHDATLERTTSGTGRVDAHAAAALGALDAGGGEGVPTLAQAAGWAAAGGWWLNVEIKAKGIEAATMEALRRAGVERRLIVSSFHAEVVREVGRLAPGSDRYLLTERWDARVRAMLRAAGANGVCLRDDAATPAVLHDCSLQRLPVVVWTVDEPVRIRALLAARVRAIITNDPALAAGVRAAWEAEREGRTG